MSLSSLALNSNPIKVPQTPFLGFRHHHLKPIILSRRPNLIFCSSASAFTSLSVAESSTTQGINRIKSLSQVSGVLGCQWGDEGKGKLVDILAHHFDIVARCQVDSAGARYLNKLEEHHDIIGRLRSNDQVTAEHTWASKELLEVIETMPYHELFIHSLEELMARGLGS
ncbi:adenylosuccinate synthetase [Quercus suber]|uniref:Adenylosuccinate synthetase n=1 Tax=Quercus suber TaxID=58331 RepID=A0AAW0MDG9_QUESU